MDIFKISRLAVDKLDDLTHFGTLPLNKVNDPDLSFWLCQLDEDLEDIWAQYIEDIENRQSKGIELTEMERDTLNTFNLYNSLNLHYWNKYEPI